MTSNHYFFKYMREDLRHKTWMIALSILGNMLALPVAFMIFQGNIAKYDHMDLAYAPSTVNTYVNQLGCFFESYSLITAGIIALGGAIIVGLTSFRYLQNKSMSDTFQSIPVKKKELFLAGYINGFLIWFVPMILSMLITIILGAGRYIEAVEYFNSLPESVLPKGTPIVLQSYGSMVLSALGTIGLLMLIYFLVYHLILVAVVMTGNALNTLTVSAILGVGVGSVYVCLGLLEMAFLNTVLVSFMETYMDIAIYLSPAALAIALMARSAEFFHIGYVIAAVVMAALLWAGTYIGFIKRPVELAEQGTKNKVLTTISTIVTSFAAGVGGWFIFTFVLNSFGEGTRSVGWGIFGCVLTAFFVCGVMHVIFQMDFAAFIKNKGMLAIGVCVPLVICLLYFYDAFGYDTYLPKKDEIASMGIMEEGYVDWSTEFTYAYDDPRHPLNQMQITDVDVIYPILENAMTHVEDDTENVIESVDEDDYYKNAYCYDRTDSIRVRITLKSGKTYYRKYTVSSKDDNSALYAALTTQEYAKHVFWIDEEAAQYVSEAILYDDNYANYSIVNSYVEGAQNRELVRKLIAAYNQDLFENTAMVFDNRDRAIASLQLYGVWGEENSKRIDKSIIITDKTSHLLQVLKENDLEDFTTGMAPEKVKQINISYEDYTSDISAEGFAKCLYACYGLDLSEATEAYAMDVVKQQMKSSLNDNGVIIEKEPYNGIELIISNPYDIEELMHIMSADVSDYYWGVFDQNENYVTVTDEKGKTYSYVLKAGDLPRKYALFFRAAFELGEDWNQ